MKTYTAHVLTFLLTLLLLLSVSPSTAYAHANLLTTVPAKNGVVPDSPAKIVLTFSEALEPDLIALKLYDRDGERVDDLSKPKLTKGKPEEMTVTLPELKKGSYTVAWSIVSEDGHPVTETYTFSVGEATPVFPPSDQPSEFEKKMFDLLMIILRYGVEGLVLVGAGLYYLSLYAVRQGLPSARQLLGNKVAVAWMLLVLGTIAEWFISSARLPSMSMTEALLEGNWDLVLQSRFAVMLLYQFGLLLLLALPSMVPAWYALVWLALVCNFVQGGHAWGLTPLTAAFISRTLHLLTIAAWMGGLAYLVTTVLYGRNEAVKLNRPAFRRFFLIVFIASSILVTMTGVWMSVMQTGIHLLLQTAPLWNRLLFLKIGMLVLMLVLALFQTLRWQREDGGLSYNLLRFELLIGVLIIQLGIWMSQIAYPIPYLIP